MEKALKITTNKDKKADRIFWETKSFAQRLEAIELLRQQYFSLNKNVQQKFQRVCRVIKAQG